MAYIDNEGVRIYCEVVSTSFPILLHPGASNNRRMWQEVGYVDGLSGLQCLL